VNHLPTHRLPEGFVWGVATSAQQIEGGRDAGGRGDSVWDRYALECRIEDGSNPFRACDHYNRWREDVEIMKWLGVGAYRFSTSWSRVMPGGGAANAEGLDFYDALVDALLEDGIEPFITLNHWDMPAEFMEHGGWASRETVAAFVEYASVVSGRLGDRVRHWTTHNEPWCIATLGYEEGCHAPGLTDPSMALPASHHLLLSHGRAAGVIRANSPGARVGIVLNLVPAEAATESEADRDAARQFDGYFNRWYLDPLFRGEYPADSIEDRVRYGHLTADAVAAAGGLPFVLDGDMREITAPLDFLGVNYYSRAVLKADGGGKAVGVDVVPKEELTEMGWEVYPDGMTELLVRVNEDYAPPEIFITENGIALPDVADDAECVDDPARVDFLRDHLLAAHRAIEAGVPLKGYFHWSLLDNFEWGHGYTKRFGLFRVNFETCERTAKTSARWYRDVIAANAVDG
jgi:beta-glucosidase